MQIRKKHYGNILSFAVVFAMAGFSFAVATQGDSVQNSVLSERTVGSMIPLSFANPFVNGSTDRDLGDAVVGSGIIRLIRAKGGNTPYNFTAGSTPPGLTLTTNGLLSGILNQSLTPAGTVINRVRFEVTVTDSANFAGARVTEMFRLSVVNTNTFRFATTALSDGVQYQSYSERVNTINGVLPITYSAATVAVNGVATKNAKLEDVGLSLATDGTVFGTPIVSGTVTFNATAADKTGAPARSRSNNAIGQTYTLPITANKFVSTQISATSIVIKEGFGSGKDSISYKGLVNLQGKTPAVLSGASVSFQVGIYSTPVAKFDATGTAKASNTVNIRVNKNGTVAANVRGETIDMKLGTTPPLQVDLAVQVMIGDLVMGSEVLRFDVKNNGKGGATLTYKPLSTNDLGGTFQLTTVVGKDDKSATGDFWKVSFVNRAPAGTVFQNISKIDVAIGTAFDSTVSPIKNVNGKVSFSGNKGVTNSVTSFSADLVKGKGTYTTSAIPATTTGISIAGQGGFGAYSTIVSYQDNAGAAVTGGMGSLMILSKNAAAWGSGR